MYFIQASPLLSYNELNCQAETNESKTHQNHSVFLQSSWFD